MAQSQNSSVDLALKATSFQGLTTYGDVMVGNAAFEFYNERNPEDYIQIPWDQVDYVSPARRSRDLPSSPRRTATSRSPRVTTRRRCAP